MLGTDTTQPIFFPGLAGWPSAQPLEFELLPPAALDPQGARRLACGILRQAQRDAICSDQDTRQEARGWLRSEDGGKLLAYLVGFDDRLIDRWLESVDLWAK